MFEHVDMYTFALDVYTDMTKGNKLTLRKGQYEEPIEDTIIELFREDGFDSCVGNGVIKFKQEVK